MNAWDVTTLGSTMLSLSSEAGVPVLGSERLRLDVAGAESNVAIALARLGKRVAWLSKVARTPIGERIVSQIRSHGVDTSRVVWSDEGRNELMWVEAGHATNRTRVTYDRAGAAIESYEIEEVDLEAIKASTFFHATGITPALSESCRNSVLDAVQLARKAGVRVSFDVNYRSKLWSPARAREVLSTIIPGVDLLLVGREDLQTVWGRRGKVKEDLHWLQKTFGVTNVVLTRGEKGASALLGGRYHRSRALASEVVSPIGAGDAFAAGLLAALLDDDLDGALAQGCTMAALARESRSDYVVGGAEALAAKLSSGEAKGDRLSR